MNEAQANAIARALCGEVWQSGGNIWLVLIERIDSRLVVISDESVCEYESQGHFDSGEATAATHLVAG